MKKVNHFNCKSKKDISMGPSVKFVLAIIDSISHPKMGVNCFSAKLGFVSDATKFILFFFNTNSNNLLVHDLSSVGPIKGFIFVLIILVPLESAPVFFSLFPRHTSLHQMQSNVFL